MRGSSESWKEKSSPGLKDLALWILRYATHDTGEVVASESYQEDSDSVLAFVQLLYPRACYDPSVGSLTPVQVPSSAERLCVHPKRAAVAHTSPLIAAGSRLQRVSSSHSSGRA
jgi:hypothetical protein